MPFFVLVLIGYGLVLGLRWCAQFGASGPLNDNVGTVYFIAGYGPFGNRCDYWCDILGKKTSIPLALQIASFAKHMPDAPHYEARSRG